MELEKCVGVKLFTAYEGTPYVYAFFRLPGSQPLKINVGDLDLFHRRKVVDTEAQLQSFARTNHASLLHSINETPKFSKDTEAALKKCCEEFVAGL